MNCLTCCAQIILNQTSFKVFEILNSETAYIKIDNGTAICAKPLLVSSENIYFADCLNKKNKTDKKKKKRNNNIIKIIKIKNNFKKN